MGLCKCKHSELAHFMSKDECIHRSFTYKRYVDLSRLMPADVIITPCECPRYDGPIEFTSK
jgi:hypothetical protein